VANPDDCGEAIHLESTTDSLVRGNLVRFNVGGILLTDEEGPVARNVIVHNAVLDNTKDCGITLPSHAFSLSGPVSPSAGGVYDNLVIGNDSERNGAAGIGIFTGPPGGAAYRNVIFGNVARDNGLPGVAIHSHTPGQLIKDNIVVNNTLSRNGADDDAQTGHDTGVVVFADKAAGAAPVQHTTVAGNRILHEYYGIFISNAVNTVGLRTNLFFDVAVPVFFAP
jgi:hypothetical protein